MSRIHPVLIFHSQFQGRLSCICTVETRTRFISSASSYHLQTAFTPLHSRVWTCWAESNKSTMKTWRSLSHCKVEPARRDKEAPLQSNLNSTLLKSSFHSPFTLISTAKPCSMRFVVLHFHENLDQQHLKSGHKNSRIIANSQPCRCNQSDKTEQHAYTIGYPIQSTRGHWNWVCVWRASNAGEVERRMPTWA